MKKLKSIAGITYNKFFYKTHQLKSNEDRLIKLKDSYKGKRCFVIGSGPSIKKTDLSLIDNEIKIGLNMLYKSGIKTDLYFIIGFRIMKNVEEILKLNNLFLGGSAGRWYLKNHAKIEPIIRKNHYKEPHVLKEFGEISIWKDISLDITKGLRGGYSVSFVALQTLLYMGFKEVYLIGHDCDYQINGQYFYNKSDIGYDRDWSTIFDNYKVVKRFYENAGSKIYNATVGGKLAVFERKSLDEIK